MKKEKKQNPEVSKLKAEIELITSINGELQNKLNEKDREIEAYKKQMDELTDEIGTRDAKIIERNKQIIELKSAYKTLSISFDIQAKMLDAMQEYIHEIKAGI